jgi:uncharacterized membrane protein
MPTNESTSDLSLSDVDDSKLDGQIGMLLRIGMLTAASVILLGGILFLVSQGQTTLDYRAFHGEPDDLKQLSGIVSGAMHGYDRAIIQLGLVILIATPVVRVLFSAFAFLKARDYLYVGISGFVFLVLMYSLIYH